jgi:probable addiction module antidote protein
MEKYRTFDALLIEQLQTDPEFTEVYLKGSLAEYEKDKDICFFLNALRRIAEARGGMTDLARKTGLSRQNLYKIFTAKSMPRVDTLNAILNALGFRLAVQPLEPLENKPLAS